MIILFQFFARIDPKTDVKCTQALSVHIFALIGLFVVTLVNFTIAISCSIRVHKRTKLFKIYYIRSDT